MAMAIHYDSNSDPNSTIGTMQNRFLNLDNFFICLAYDDLMVGISDGNNCFWQNSSSSEKIDILSQELQKCGRESFGTDKR